MSSYESVSGGLEQDNLSVKPPWKPWFAATLSVNGDELEVSRDPITVGELRSFSGRGHEAIYVCYPRESSNIDVFAIHLKTVNIRRLTSHPGYVDPIHTFPDDKWFVIGDTRGSGRQMFMAGMRGIPPVPDLVSASVTTATRNNGTRRFFQPFLLDHYGDRGEYFSQKINGPRRGVPDGGDVDDPEWNAMAEPRWSPYGNEIVHWEAQTISPECGEDNYLLCCPPKVPWART